MVSANEGSARSIILILTQSHQYKLALLLGHSCQTCLNQQMYKSSARHQMNAMDLVDIACVKTSVRCTGVQPSCSPKLVWGHVDILGLGEAYHHPANQARP